MKNKIIGISIIVFAIVLMIIADMLLIHDIWFVGKYEVFDVVMFVAIEQTLFATGIVFIFKKEK